MNANDIRLMLMRNCALRLLGDAMCRLVEARGEDARLRALLWPNAIREPLASIGRAERDVAVCETAITRLT